MNKLLSCHYNMDTNRVEARFADGTTLAIDCIAIEDEYGNTPAQRAELDWLLYNKPLEYLQQRQLQAGVQPCHAGNAASPPAGLHAGGCTGGHDLRLSGGLRR